MYEPSFVNGKFKAKKYNFSMIPNSVIQNKELSLKAKGLYTLIQSLITRDNDMYKWHIMQQCNEGKKAFNSAWEELKEHGFLKITRKSCVKSGRNKFFYEYELLDYPQ